MRRVLLIAGIVGILAFPAFADGDDSVVDLKEWARGPVRYLITREEERAFKKLDSDDARASFVERFWSRRDPTPDTWFNEYRQMFWQRVTEANEKFLDSAGPGWKTDRGKIYILYGPPERTQEDTNANVQGIEPTATRGLLRWIYESRPGGRNDLPNIVVVPFVKTTTGEFKLSADPRLASIFFDPQLLADRTSPNSWDRYRAENAGTGTRLDVLLDLGKMQEVPPQEQVLLERVETRETYAQRPLAVRLDRYQPEGTPGTLVVVTLDLPPSDDAPALVVRFTARDAPRPPKILAEGAFRIERGPEGRVAQGRVPLEPGTWDVLALAVDPRESANRIWRGSIAVAAPSTALRLSDPVLAWRVEPLEYRGLTGYDAPYTFGGFRIVPRLSPALARGEPIQVFLEAYGGRAPYEGTFAVEGREDDGRFTALGSPQSFRQPSGSFAWSLPTGPHWPLGEYRVRIEVVDADGTLVPAVVPFRIEARE
ncbi:MAG TPA: GWxTD domain-containing protein [Candidatus Polarisedimenticolaceae bacterium]